jgi:hypothetical protein
MRLKGWPWLAVLPTLILAAQVPAVTAFASATTFRASVATSQESFASFTGRRGVTVLLYGYGVSDTTTAATFAAKAAARLDHIRSIGAQSVSLTIPLFQSALPQPSIGGSTDIHADTYRTPSPANVETFVQLAHQRGMTVLLRPLLDDQNLSAASCNADHTSCPIWRGMIDAGASQGTWFANYQAALLLYATLGPEQVDVLDVGSEFDTLQSKYPDLWSNLIGVLRQSYAGALTYSSNWGNPYPSFWPLLDVLGIDAFFPLNAPNNATSAQLVQAWQQWLPQLAQLRGKPVIFTEIGVTSQVGAYRLPWDWNPGTGLSLETQRLYYAASCAAVPLHIGMYWWAYYNLDPLPSPLTDVSYDPEGKPAEAEISNCLRAAYTLDGLGGLHQDGGSFQPVNTPYFGFRIARSEALLPDATGGYVLDGFGGLHPFAVGNHPVPITPANAPYFPGLDIARDVVLLPDSTAQNPKGYVLDGWGALHPFGAAPAIGDYPYFPGNDIAKRLALLADGSGGYILDGWGALHPFSFDGHPRPMDITNFAYFPGFSIARDFVLMPGSTATSAAGLTLDGWGALHPFSNGMAVNPPQDYPYFPNHDIARAVRLTPGTSAGHPQGYILDGWGAPHPFGGAAPIMNYAYFPHNDVAVQLIVG